MRLSVVIVNWNSRQDLIACLQSLSAQTHQDLEIVVVDNGSTDGSAAAVREQFPSCVLLPETENLGFAEGCNRGIRATRGEWVALLNNDTIADPAWAERLVAAAEEVPKDCGMLQSVLLFMDRPALINSTGIVLTSGGSGNDRDEGQPFGNVSEAEIFCPTAGACAYRRAMLDAIELPSGYFDREHFMYCEDLDLGWRARLAGWSARVVPDSVVLHRYQGSAVRHGRNWMLSVSFINRLRTLVKNASPSFIAQTARRSLKEIIRLGSIGGPRALYEAGEAIVVSAQHRRAVTRLATTSREEVERTWVNRTARPIAPRDGLRLGFVVQRYGREVNGGAELHCRELAEHLVKHSDVADVTVLTTCARNHETWENHYRPGPEQINGVNIERHEVAMPRFFGYQAKLEDLLASKFMPRARPLEHAWNVAQGPFSPSLLARIRASRDQYDALIFFTYLYSPTVHGLPLASGRSILVPTAHDEPAIRMDIFRGVFHAPRAFAFNTPEERDFVQTLFDVDTIPNDVVGCGVAVPGSTPPLSDAPPTRWAIRTSFISGASKPVRDCSRSSTGSKPSRRSITTSRSLRAESSSAARS
jgi:GT2 family glycosyltransferase